MTSYTIEPAVPGDLANEAGVDWATVPPTFTDVPLFEFVLPTEAALVSAIATYFVRPTLADAITSAGLTGVGFSPARVRKDDQFAMLYPDLDLGEWVWMHVDGVEGVDDAWRNEQHLLTVTERFLTLLRTFELDDVDVTVNE